jgi:hypothetical protein
MHQKIQLIVAWTFFNVNAGVYIIHDSRLDSLILSLHHPNFRINLHKGAHLPWLETQQAHRAKDALWACD